MNVTANQILIVGGGTAGWITACYLAKQLSTKEAPPVKITLIESADIGTIGVGEGTFPTFRVTLSRLGISESKFMRECGATFKQAIKFVNWLHAPAGGRDNYYYHLFDPPLGAPGFDLLPYWLAIAQKSDVPFADAVSAQSRLCDEWRAPKKITTKEYDGLHNYAYHLDAIKFAHFLRKHAVEELGVTHLVGNVHEVNLANDGFVHSVQTEEHGLLTADFFVDCSGFSSLILGQKLQVPFIDRGHQLFVDHAVTMQVPYDDDNSPIASNTISTAHEAGWTWDIGLNSRRGIGYVYSSNHTSHERAEIVLRDYVGEQSNSLPTRLIKMQIGHRKVSWEKNCVAIGLSSGFIEPLESTAIIMIELAAYLLAEEFPRSREYMPIAAKKFNQAFAYRWDGIIDFVKLHYYLSKRTDSPFWIDNTNPEYAPTSMLEKVEKWHYQPPTRHDFPSMYDVFGRESYQYVLYGMKFNTRPDATILKAGEMAAKQYFDKVIMLRNANTGTMPTHRSLINAVYEHGFSKI